MTEPAPAWDARIRHAPETDDFEAPDRRPEFRVRDVRPQDRSREPVLWTYDVHAAVRELERLTADLTPAA
ncbi:hypothetical protein Snoj_21330 [Streptomyces nojiriensis]|uniref:Uncharacterized protein n=1 Tax=Streptomyces nojiriensis TaxID=66374 RepID=A0ABQ3SJA8_9ACTN|nr:hypothetical protein [Streptomyces nojiriensis]QTI49822.1 hypothetical protein JYK04_07695 [Streptomyces nojiriensis]GGS20537.1 hypothetical protein GCM10010205_58110 [Streptomyces nojiriensis]GHI68215.1 hypothetical protein Snoj_21330 [Streptomyces nojiriensis]